MRRSWRNLLWTGKEKLSASRYAWIPCFRASREVEGSEDTKQGWPEDDGGAHRPARRGSSGGEEAAVLGFLGLVSLVLNCKREIPSRNWDLHLPALPPMPLGCSLFFSSREERLLVSPNWCRLRLSSARGSLHWTPLSSYLGVSFLPRPLPLVLTSH